MRSFAAAAARGRQGAHDAATATPAKGTEGENKPRTARDIFGTYEQQIEKYSIVSGTPKTVIPRVRHVLEYLRPGTIFFWDGDGAMTHDDQMRSLRLMGEEVIPAVREIAKELDLKGPFEVDPNTGKSLDGAEAAQTNMSGEAEAADAQR